MKFYDLHVHSVFSDGESKLEELAETAKFLGYSGIGFIFYWLGNEENKILEKRVKDVGKEVGIETFIGYEARNLKELRILKKRRRNYDILLVSGGNLRLNRIACETPEVDILAHPNLGRKDAGINHIMAKLARENSTAIEINFSLLKTKEKTLVIKQFAEIIKICTKYDCNLIFSSGAFSKFDLKDPKVLISLGRVLGLELKEAKSCVSLIPQSIIKKIKERRSEKWIMPGVKVLKW